MSEKKPDQVDYNGNAQTIVNSSGTTTYAWDFENRLTSVVLPGSGGTVYFKYDPFGRRIYKSSSSGTSIYAYDGDNLVEETNGTGSVVARYSQGLNIDEPLVMLRNATTSYYHADGLGSLTSLSNTSGALASTYTYDSFGNLVASSGSIVNNFRYTGREFDPEASLYYYRARYYDPHAGRFLSEDPVGFLGGINKYNYVFSDPANWVDNRGTCPCPDPQEINEQIEEAKDEMVQNMVLPVKGAVSGGIGGFILGCMASLEVGCLEGGIPGAAVGALGGLIEGAGEQLYEDTKLLLKIRKLLKSIPPGCPH